MTEPRDPASPSSRPPLAGILEDVVVPDSLQSRVEHSLLNAGLLRNRRSYSRATLVMTALAASLAFFVVGFETSELRARVAPIGTSHAQTRFLLLLYSPPGTIDPPDGVEQYRKWAVNLASNGHRISGEELSKDRGVIVAQVSDTSTVVDNWTLGGFFIVSARDEAEAVTIAKSSPHALRGGRVVVRRITPS